jgi:hypothetical protein
MDYAYSSWPRPWYVNEEGEDMNPFEDLYDEWAAEMDAETEREAKAESEARIAELLAEWAALMEEQWAEAEAAGDEDTLVHLREIKALRAQWEAEEAEREAEAEREEDVKEE